MKHRAHHGWREGHDRLNRGDYRGDFGPEGHERFANPPDHDGQEHREGHERRHRHDHDGSLDPDDRRGERTAGPWRWRRAGREGWQRGRVSGGYGSPFAAWSSGAGYTPAGFGFGPEEAPRPGGFDDQDGQPTEPARGRGAWAADWSDRDDYRGRGPRGYQRADDRIKDEVCERLTDDDAVDATDVSVQVQNGEVTLTGAVPSREQKRRAEECALEVRGVHDVFNQLRVTASAPRQWEGGRR